MPWEEVDEWHMKNGDWTLTKPGKQELYPLPYALWQGKESRGYFKTSKDAIAAWKVLTAKD